MLTVNDVIRRMEEGQPLRWVLKSAADRLADGCPDTRELWIGRTLILSSELIMDIALDPSIREVKCDDGPVVDYELAHHD